MIPMAIKQVMTVYAESVLWLEKQLSDLAGRYGGEEFADILPYADQKEGWVMAEMIREALLNCKFTPAGSGVEGISCVNINAGVATFSRKERERPEEIIGVAGGS
jgi:PleD family two-component response regulator